MLQSLLGQASAQTPEMMSNMPRENGGITVTSRSLRFDSRDVNGATGGKFTSRAAQEDRGTHEDAKSHEGKETHLNVRGFIYCLVIIDPVIRSGPLFGSDGRSGSGTVLSP